MRLPLLIGALAISGTAQGYAPGDDGQALLAEVRKKLMVTLNRLPRFMCTENIDRSTSQPKAKVTKRQLPPLNSGGKEAEPAGAVSCDEIARLRKKADWQVRKDTFDRLRLDVAVSSDREIFSWAGANRFQDRSLAELVRRGATSTGAFGSFLAAIFGTNAADFSYNGNVNVEGRALVEFAFRMPVEKSTFQIGNEAHQDRVVPYEGTFLVDPKTFDLVRLTARADRIPPELNICENITTLDYGSVRLHDSEFLLPKQVRLQVVTADGSELENRTEFSGCHEFLAESSLSFEAEPSGGAQGADGKAASQTPGLPPGLPFRLELTREIDTATAAAGDRIEARLSTPIKGKNKAVLVPKGAAVRGRIIQLKRLYGTGFETLTLAVRLETVEVNGAPQPFDARLDSAVVRRTVRRSFHSAGGAFGQMSDPKDPTTGFFEFQDVRGNYVIDRGVEMDGATAAR